MGGVPMEFLRIDDVLLHYRRDGTPGGKRLVFLNSLGTDHRIWDAVLPQLPPGCDILRYDKRGHGLSEATPAPYTIAGHASDILGLMDALGWQDATFIGISVGGMIAQEIAVTAPERVVSLVLCDTAAKIGTAEMWNGRIQAIEADGLASIGAAVITRWFTAGFAAANPDAVAGWRLMLERTPVAGYAGTCAAIRDADLTDAVPRITAPTLCLVGDDDQSTPPDLVRDTAGRIPGARFEIIESAGHLPCIEQPQILAGLIEIFLKEPVDG